MLAKNFRLLSFLSSLLRSARKLFYAFFLLGLFFGIGLSSLYWQKEIKVVIERKDEEINLLKDAGESLREEKFEIANRYTGYQFPVPTPAPFVKGESLKGTNVYSLVCSKTEESLAFDWLESLKEKLNEGENIHHLCYNQELKSVAAITIKETNSRSSPQRVVVYDLTDNRLMPMLEENSSIYYGCWEILAWTKTGNLYYRCSGGNGATGGSWGIYKVSVFGAGRGITESCYDYDDGEYSAHYCTHYCASSSDCSKGEFCDLETSSCVRYCQKGNICPAGSICRAYGPVMGCQ
jgi:hypothetical protein